MESSSPNFYVAISNLKNTVNNFDPFPWFEKMRREAPVHYDDQGKVWNVFRYEDAKRVAEDRDNFSNKYLPTEDSLSRGMQAMDPPRHTAMRSIVNRAFTPSVMKEWQPRIQEITGQLLNRLDGRQEIELVKDLSVPLPVRVIAELLGVPTDHADQFKQWSDIIMSAPKDNSQDEISIWSATKYKCLQELADFFKAIIQKKRANPQNDIISILAQAEEGGNSLSEEDLAPFCTLLLSSGNETTTHLISNAIFSILSTPGAYEALRNDPELIPQAVEETLRFRPPSPIVIRIAKNDVEIGGQRIREGQMVFAFLASGNRDASKFVQPDMFDIYRHPNPHITLGHGIHFCLGAPLARLEAITAVTALVKKYSSMTFPENFIVEPLENTVMCGLKRFPIWVRPASC